MNQKGFANIIVIGIAVVILLGVAGYFVLVKQPPVPTQTQQTPPSSVTKIPSSPTKLGLAGTPLPPADQALAEVTVLSAQIDGGWKIRIDKVRDYIRYPAATNPQLKIADTISIGFDRWLDTAKMGSCPAGYTPVYKTTEAQFPAPPPPPQPKIIVGEKYLAELFGCFTNETFSCPKGIKGWSASFYNPTPVAIEPECVKEGTIPIPPPEPQR